MNPKTIAKRFIFNSNIDSAFLYNLYEEDYSYITEVFGNSVHNLNEDLPTVEEAYYKNDLEALRKAVHKLKPVFGFTGLLECQELIGAFEKDCSKTDVPEHISEGFRILMQNILMAKIIMEEEHKRLTIFIQ